MSNDEPIGSTRGLKPWATLALLGVTIIWGWTFVLIKQSLGQMSVFSFLFYRFLAALLTLVLLFPHKVYSALREELVKGGSIGAVLFCGYLFQTWGLEYTTATKSGFITGLFVVFVPVMGMIFYRDRVNRLVWLGVLSSILGLSLVLFSGSSSITGVNVGDLLTLVAAFAFAGQILLIGKYCDSENYVSLLVVQVIAVTVLSGLGSVVRGGFAYPTSFTAWKGVLITGIFATALAFWAQNRFQPRTSSSRAAIIFSGEPVFSAMFGYLLLGEVFRGWQWAGAFFILLAIVLANWPRERSPTS